MDSIPHFGEIKSLWKGEKQGDGGSTILTKMVLTLLIASQLFSPSMLKYLFKGGKPLRREFMHIYVLAWLILLSYLLASSGPDATAVVWVVPAWEISNLLLYRLYFVFVKSRLRPWVSSSIRRSLFLSALNIVEIVLAFAILFRCNGKIISTQPVIRDFTALSSLYFSLTTITTVGMGDFVPADDRARLLVGAEIISGMLMLLLILPSLVSVVSSELRGDPEKTSSSQKDPRILKPRR